MKKISTRIMLLLFLLVGVFNLSACEWKNIFTTTTEDMDGGYGSIVEIGWRADNFSELAVSIKQQFPEGYTFVTFDFENDDNYTANPYYVHLKGRLIENGKVDYYWNTANVESEAEINGFGNENHIMIRFSSVISNSFDYSEAIVFEIKEIDKDVSGGIVNDYYPKYTASHCFGVYADDKFVIHLEIAAPTIELLNEVILSDFFETLKEYIVIGGVI
ncbi:MAG: hypothetical protein IKA84_00290 [Clostridia bacterium]|nr:hypothetical protein [Clostridia bacterium]